MVGSSGRCPELTLVAKDSQATDPDAPGGIAEYVLKGLTDQWRRYEIPFGALKPREAGGRLDWRSINHVGIAMIAPQNAASGTFWVDNLWAEARPRQQRAVVTSASERAPMAPCVVTVEVACPKRRPMVAAAATTRLGVMLMAFITSSLVAGEPATGPLRVSTQNPRYFADAAGKIVYLTGSHTWNNLQDMGKTDPPPAFDWEGYLDLLVRHRHNFVRLWRWELTIWDTQANNESRRHFCTPHPWPRSGPGVALDGKPRFDLTRFDEVYFARLRERVASAGPRGIYVSVMLFEGWGLQFVENGWRAHPFHPGNNVNGLGSEVNGDGKGLQIHELRSPAVVAIEEAYVRKVVDTVNDLDNVLYEISNENHPASTEWQVHMIRLIHDYERSKPKQHPVGMTFQYQGGANKTLFESPADWVSPNPEGGYNDSPPAADGRKVILSDTDHLWGIGGNVGWVWKSLCRGLNPIFMDPYDGTILGTDSKWEMIRQALGQARAVADRLPLASMAPRNDLASTQYCLANPGKEYLVYLPEGGEVTVDLSAATATLAVEWMHPITGTITTGAAVAGGTGRVLQPPFGGDAVLYLWKKP